MLPNLASCNLAHNFQLASAVQLSKLPSLLLVQDGFIVGSSISSPSPEDLTRYCLSDWSHFENRRALKLRSDIFSPYDIVFFDWVGRLVFPVQEIIVGWIHTNKILAASSMLVVTFVVSLCHMLGLLQVF